MSSDKRASAPMRLPLHWLGVLPFAAFAVLFLILPTMNIVIGAFQTADGQFTLENIYQLFTDRLDPGGLSDLDQDQRRLGAAGLSDRFRHVGGDGAGRAAQGDPQPASDLFGRGLELRRRAAGLRLSGDAWSSGMVTVFLRTQLGINLRSLGFNILSFWGLTLTYLFFQIPLMILIITPALDGLKKEWKEAASILGATGPQYWRMVALPILFPSLLGDVRSAVCQCIRRRGDRYRADRLFAEHRADPACSRRSGVTFWATRISAMRWPSG
jgi:putative spermidine/putrescine transport system permease protein